MELINEIFFGEHGLTSTSATHLANIAQETIVSHEEIGRASCRERV